MNELCTYKLGSALGGGLLGYYIVELAEKKLLSHSEREKTKDFKLPVLGAALGGAVCFYFFCKSVYA